MTDVRHVLIAEDNPDLRNIFEVTFEQSRLVVDSVVDGRQALDYLESVIPDLVVLDINMPHISGLEVLKFIREHPDMVGTKVIVVTGNHLAENEDVADLADLFLIKPVDVFELMTLVQRLLS